MSYPPVYESIQVARFWGDYPLDVRVVRLRRRFQLGPFPGRARWERPRVPPLPEGDGDRAEVTLEGLAGTTRRTFAIPPDGVLRIADGAVSLHVTRGPALPRVGRAPLLEPSLLLSGLLAVLVGAACLIAVARSVPALGALADLAFVRTRPVPPPVLPSLRQARWAIATGTDDWYRHRWLPVDLVPPGLPLDRADCRGEAAPPCPPAASAESVAALLHRGLAEGESLGVIVDGRLERGAFEDLRLVPVQGARRREAPASLRLTATVAPCSEGLVGRRVLVSGVLFAKSWSAGLPHVPDDTLTLDGKELCAVVPGTEPSAPRADGDPSGHPAPIVEPPRPLRAATSPSPSP